MHLPPIANEHPTFKPSSQTPHPSSLPARFATSFAYYGLVMDLQGFGVSIYLIQVIFGAVDLPAKLVGFLAINHLGRRPAQIASLLLAGICILANGVIPQGEHIGPSSLASSPHVTQLLTRERGHILPAPAPQIPQTPLLSL